MVSILEALVRNPSFSSNISNASFSQIPVLRGIFHDSRQDFLQPLGSVASVALYQKSLRPFTLAVCLATDPLSPKFVDQDLFAHVLGDMRIAVSNGDLAEVKQSQAVLQALSLCINRKGSRFQRYDALECRSRSSGTLKDGSSPSFFDLAPTEEAFLNLLPVCETGGWMEKDNRTILHLAAEKNFGRPFVEIMNSKNKSLIPDVHSTYMDTSMVGVDKKSSWVRVVGRAAIHDACRSGCGLCVKALAKNAPTASRMALNLTIFPSWWDPVFHPWMYEYLVKNSERNNHNYKSIWNVQPIHIATVNRCSECLEALVKSASGTETFKDVLEARLSLGHTRSYMATEMNLDTQKHVFGQTDVSDPSCFFSALDLAVLTNCSSCAQILLQAGANASHITLDHGSSMEKLPVLDELPKNVTVQRCSLIRLTDKRRDSQKVGHWPTKTRAVGRSTVNRCVVSCCPENGSTILHRRLSDFASGG